METTLELIYLLAEYSVVLLFAVAAIAVAVAYFSPEALGLIGESLRFKRFMNILGWVIVGSFLLGIAIKLVS